MTDGQRRDTSPTPVEEWAAGYQQSADLLLDERRKSMIEVALGSHFRNHDLPSERTRSLLRVSHHDGLAFRIVRVHQNGDDGHVGNHLMQQSEPLGTQVGIDKAYPGDISLRAIEAGDDA